MVPTTKNPLITEPHVDDWVQTNEPQSVGEAYAMLWLEHFRRPAIQVDGELLGKCKLFCTYKPDGKRYRCIGASRFGDVWLTADFTRENGYDMRIKISDCTHWGTAP